ncbi:hypothetical protein [Clostridioides sp. ZZV15-6388]|uniref:hypothetical protein n=1 Tax=unclassified Clostridioides TaxID=2635829 RepID=UPI001D1052C7|nr:hypothetical protein [Clostridioides sp. ZZV15-6388]MCC0666164.1 hypothetical protein [Clostridioides sp. ZZV15-6597]
MFLNRIELFKGYSLDKFNEICDILSVNKIEYKYKVRNNVYSKRLSNNKMVLGNLGQKEDFSYEYSIYVHKDDYEQAFALINSKFR